MSSPTESPLPPASAVLINRNDAVRLERAVRSLLDQDVRLVDIVLVDDASTDDSVAHMRSCFPECTVVPLSQNVGPAAARNVGLRHATTDLVVLMDADMTAAPDCVRRLLEAHAAYGGVAVMPRILLMGAKTGIQADGAAVHFVGTQLLRNGYAPIETPAPAAGVSEACLSGCLLVDRTRVLDAGGFDENFFMLFEDMEFGLRLRSLGHTLIYTPAAVAYHDWGPGTPEVSFRGREAYPERRAFLTMRNRVQTVLVHYRLRTLIVLAPALLLYELATLAMAVKRGWFGTWARCWWWQLQHAGSIRDRRRAMQRRRCRADRELLQNGPLPFSQGFLESPFQRRAVQGLSALLSAYWRVARRLIG